MLNDSPKFFLFLGCLLLAVALVSEAKVVHPDLAVAPPPDFSQTAWREITSQGTHGSSSMVIKVQMNVRSGAIKEAYVVGKSGIPHVKAELVHWIQTQWKFVHTYSGNITQPVEMVVSKRKPIQEGQKKANPSVAKRFLKYAPKPPFPEYLADSISAYHNTTQKAPVSSVVITVKKGVMTDIRVDYQTGPKELSAYLVAWIRDHWEYYPSITGQFHLPVYFTYNRKLEKPTAEW
jgi:hypothetical protein